VVVDHTKLLLLKNLPRGKTWKGTHPWKARKTPFGFVQTPAVRMEAHRSITTPLLAQNGNFPSCLRSILDRDPTFNSISWDSGGHTFTIHNERLLEAEVLPLYFRHNQWQSFVRQLHYYGFEQVQIVKGHHGIIKTFQHFEDVFQRDKPELSIGLGRRQRPKVDKPEKTGAAGGDKGGRGARGSSAPKAKGKRAAGVRRDPKGYNALRATQLYGVSAMADARPAAIGDIPSWDMLAPEFPSPGRRGNAGRCRGGGENSSPSAGSDESPNGRTGTGARWQPYRRRRPNSDSRTAHLHPPLTTQQQLEHARRAMVLMRGNARNRDALSALSFLAHATLVPPDVLLQPLCTPREPPPPNMIVAVAAAEEGQRDAHGHIVPFFLGAPRGGVALRNLEEQVAVVPAGVSGCESRCDRSEGSACGACRDIVGEVGGTVAHGASGSSVSPKLPDGKYKCKRPPSAAEAEAVRQDAATSRSHTRSLFRSGLCWRTQTGRTSSAGTKLASMSW